MDIFYTPADVAKKMVEYSSVEEVSIIADFSVGGGDLLRTAQEVWPNAIFLGTDINSETAKRLKDIYPQWLINECNFLEFAQRNGNRHILSKFIGKVSLILLNPPFSCRGSLRRAVPFDTISLKSSFGLAFVVTALPFLSSEGQLITLLPTGSLTSQKDRESWEILGQHYKIETLQRNNHKTFENCSPETVIVKFTKKKKKSKRVVIGHKFTVTRTLQASKNISVELYRGKVSANFEDSGPRTKIFIHSTELQQMQINLQARRIYSYFSSLKGPAVLLPRVGRPNVTKLTLYFEQKDIVLSDCVIAIKCKTDDEAETVYELVKGNWKTVETLYNGTCAKFITLDSLRDLLNLIGIEVNNQRERVSNLTNGNIKV